MMPTASPTFRYLCAAVATSITLAACASSTEPTATPAEARGTRVGTDEVRPSFAPQFYGPAMAWSANGARIIYATGTATAGWTLKSADAVTGVPQVLDTSALAYQVVRVSPAGDAVYASVARATGAAGGRLVRIPMAGGARSTLLSDVGAPYFAISGTERYIAYVPASAAGSSDSLMLVDRRSPGSARRMLGVSARPVDFSPDSAQIITATGDPVNALDAAPLAGGAATPVWRYAVAAPTDPINRVTWTRWESNALRTMMATFWPIGGGRPTEFYERDAAGVNIRKMGELPAVLVTTPAQWGWARDGQRSAVWIATGCLQQGASNAACPIFRYVLYALGPTSTVAQIIASANTATPPTDPIFSPDGRRVAYAIDGALYVQALPF